MGGPTMVTPIFVNTQILTEKEKQDLKLGALYADWLTLVLHQRGIETISQFCTLEFQYRYGEGVSGVEIKYDGISETTRRLFIEVSTRREYANSWTSGGIFQTKMPWYYQGNSFQLWKFKTTQLVDQSLCGGWEEKLNSEGTSKGFLLPEERADQIVRPLYFSETERAIWRDILASQTKTVIV